MESNRKILVFRVGSLFHTLKQYRFTVGLMCLFVLSAGAYECPHHCKCVETSGQCQEFGESQRQPLDSTTLGLPLNVSRRVQNTTLEENKASNLTNRCKNGEDCQRKEFEAVSYVFLGIVLALIGVVFLMVLYLNRRGIKRWLNNIREACRDQMEVYHYRYEQDSDPRLANVAV